MTLWEKFKWFFKIGWEFQERSYDIFGHENVYKNKVTGERKKQRRYSLI